MPVQAEYYGGATDRSQVSTGNLPEIAFVGRSNVGKSSLINCLTSRRNLARTSKSPGRTRSLQFFIIDERLFFVDLPGYGFARVPKQLRQDWQEMVLGYLRSSAQLKLVVLVIDARHEPSAMDLQMMTWLRQRKVPHVVAATKTDYLPKTRLKPQGRELRQQLGISDLVLFSSRTGEGKPDLWRLIQNSLK